MKVTTSETTQTAARPNEGGMGGGEPDGTAHPFSDKHFKIKINSTHIQSAH